MSTPARSSRPAPWSDSGEFGAALAEGFARRIGALAQRLGQAQSRYAGLARRARVSRATSAAMSAYPSTVSRSATASLWTPLLRRCRRAACSGGAEDAAALRPLVVDPAGRLYLARYYDDERRAEAVVEHAMAADAVGALAGRIRAAQKPQWRGGRARYRSRRRVRPRLALALRAFSVGPTRARSIGSVPPLRCR